MLLRVSGRLAIPCARRDCIFLAGVRADKKLCVEINEVRTRAVCNIRLIKRMKSKGGEEFGEEIRILVGISI